MLNNVTEKLARNLAERLGGKLIVDATAKELARMVKHIRALIWSDKVDFSNTDMSLMTALYYIAKYPHLARLVEEKGIKLDKEKRKSKEEKTSMIEETDKKGISGEY